MSIAQKCKIDGCVKTGKPKPNGTIVFSRGYCVMHYTRWLNGDRGGRLTRPEERISGRVCKVNGCKKKHSGKGYCEAHLTRYRKYGRPLEDKPIEERSYHRSKYPYEYKIYRNIKSRIFNANNPHYHNYGGRGLTLDDDFKHSFVNFINEVGARPEKGLTLDRINNNKGYVKGNMRWTNRTVQTYNQRVKKTNTTGYTGVTKVGNKYMARCGFRGVRKSLGNYSTANEAHLAVEHERQKRLRSLGV